MEIIKGVTNLKVYDNTLFHLEDIEKAYTTYLDKLLKSGLSPKTIGLLLHVLKNRELLFIKCHKEKILLILWLNIYMEKID